MRIGHGYDVHRLVEGRKCIIGGVDIPHNKGLLGHSDADVLLHAVMDAVIGAMAMGDIGHLFPDNSAEFKDIDSMLLCERVSQIMHENGYTIGNIDSTVIAQKPKLAPYINEMRENIAKVFNTDVANVSVKATTEEKLGFTGDELGVAAHAVCLIQKVK